MYCIYCSKNPLLDAQIGIPCGHSFCGFCVERMRESARASSCQLCRQPVDEFYPNRKANSMLSVMEGSCRWCNETFPLDTSIQHVRECHSLEIFCNSCKERIKRNDIHHNQVCPNQETQCDCGQMVFRGKLEEHKRNECPFKEVPCSLQCGALVKR